jgi:hypothetical protein
MNAETWQAENNRYLTVSLAWLRLRLAALTQPQTTPHPADTRTTPLPEPIATPTQPTLFRRLWGAQAAGANGAAEHTPPLLEDFSLRPDKQLEQAHADRTAIAASMEPPPALLILSRQLGLSLFEQETLLLCIALELDTRIAALCAQAQGDANRPYPTFALALALFEGASWDALSPDRPLRYWRLVEINQPGSTPLTVSPLHADERIVSFVKGLNVLDDRLSVLLLPLAGAEMSVLAPSQQTIVHAILGEWRGAPGSAPLPVAQLVGMDTGSKQLVAQVTATTLQRQLLRLRADSLPNPASELELLARLWQRESQLLPLALYVDAQSSDAPPPELQNGLERFLLRVADGGSVILVAIREALPRLPTATFTVEVSKPTPGEQRAAWVDALQPFLARATPDGPPLDVQGSSARLSSQFSLNLPDIHQLVASVLTDAEVGVIHPPEPRLWDACRALTRPRLDALAQRLDARATWDDLVLPEESTRLLRQIAGQVQQRNTVYEAWGFGQKMNRGLGISALFAGESGTGKTMAAEVIANDLRLNLYRIDLSAVVSKYIGETEKNLRRLFDAAEDGGVILFFDEADALFGKRSEVKDSHDRYANIEINYLLQRMESYRGLAILATNMKSALDPAFLRRLRFVVQFTYPAVAERRVIWQKVFPPQTPTAGLEYDRLARLNLSGGNIHSIAINAAFAAAQAGEAVTMPIVLAAARTEFRKLEKPINEADFRS